MDPGLKVSKSLVGIHWLPLNEPCSSFKRWINKLGSSVVAAHCDTKQKFHIFGQRCPYIEAVLFYRLPETLLRHQQYEKFMRLHWVSLNRCSDISEGCVCRYIASDMLKGLEISGLTFFTGHSLTFMTSTNLTSLTIHQCEDLSLCHLVSAADRFGELRQLSLLDVPTNIYNNIQLLLVKTPKLDHLNVYISSFDYRDLNDISNGNLFNSVRRLTKLRHFGSDLGASNEDLEAVARSCPELRSLLLENCADVTGRGLEAVCRLLGARLTSLGVAGGERVTDDDVEACVRACPNLEALDVRFATSVTEDVLERVQAARRPQRARTLRLYAHSTGLMENCINQGDQDGVLLTYSFAGPTFDENEY